MRCGTSGGDGRNKQTAARVSTGGLHELDFGGGTLGVQQNAAQDQGRSRVH